MFISALKHNAAISPSYNRGPYPIPRDPGGRRRVVQADIQENRKRDQERDQESRKSD